MVPWNQLVCEHYLGIDTHKLIKTLPIPFPQQFWIHRNYWTIFRKTTTKHYQSHSITIIIRMRYSLTSRIKLLSSISTMKLHLRRNRRILQMWEKWKIIWGSMEIIYFVIYLKFQLFTDGWFLEGMDSYLRKRLAHPKSGPTFVYLFSHKGAASFTEIFGGGRENYYGRYKLFDQFSMENIYFPIHSINLEILFFRDLSCWRASISISDWPKFILQLVAYEKGWRDPRGTHWIVGELCTLWVRIPRSWIWIETQNLIYLVSSKETRHHLLANCQSGSEHRNFHSITIALETRMKMNLLLRWKQVFMTTVPSSGEKLAPICQRTPEGMSSKLNKSQDLEVK